MASETYGDGLYFFKRQLIFVGLALAALLFSAHFPYRLYLKFFWVFFALQIFLLLVLFVPGVGYRAGGALRWINLPFGFHLEPSELVKLMAPISFSFLLMDREERDRKFWLSAALVVLLPVVLLLKQPDLGSAIVFFLIGFSLLFCFGLPWKYIGSLVLLAIPAFYFLVLEVPYRRQRVLSFLNPWDHPESGGFQIIQSLLSFFAGGISGVGIGKGQGKLFFLPEAHTDFILAVLGEETGFIGLMVVLILFSWLVLRGFQIAIQCEEPFGRRLALGMSCLIAFQILINVCVVLGLLPTKGLAMPFLSYGGSHLIATAIACGTLLNIRMRTES